jgi:hypothetical protein
MWRDEHHVQEESRAMVCCVAYACMNLVRKQVSITCYRHTQHSLTLAVAMLAYQILSLAVRK